MVEPVNISMEQRKAQYESLYSDNAIPREVGAQEYEPRLLIAREISASPSVVSNALN